MSLQCKKRNCTSVWSALVQKIGSANNYNIRYLMYICIGVRLVLAMYFVVPMHLLFNNKCWMNYYLIFTPPLPTCSFRKFSCHMTPGRELYVKFGRVLYTYPGRAAIGLLWRDCKCAAGKTAQGSARR